MRHALKVGAQGFDEIRIVTVPRFKESELSGDEWRYHADMQFFRKGKLICSSGARDVEMACAHLGYRHSEALDNGNGYFAGEDGICDQEGCAEKAEVWLEIIRGYTRDGDEKRLSSEGEYRNFCKRHSHRGDCALEDADTNYKEITRLDAETRK